MAHAVAKYLRKWAEPEAALAAAVHERYERALVVPSYRESASLIAGFERAAATSSGATLCILVVNAPDDASEAEHRENRIFYDTVVATLADRREASAGVRRGVIGTSIPGKLDVLVVDRAAPGACLPRKEGVGLARKIGFDIALALHESDHIRGRFIFGTDADAALPEAYFDLPKAQTARDVSAWLFPFWHERNAHARVTRATALYELQLRYYVAGLAFAGSPYAFHTLGSAMAIGVDAYAAVRGVPKREAAEDFYLLNKVAKVGRVALAETSPVKLQSRESNRTPFGTGAAVRDALRGAEPVLYAPACFVALRATLDALERFAEHADVDRFFDELARSVRADEHEALITVFTEASARTAFEAASREAKTRAERRRRVHVWFDAFRTLKVVHALRDRVHPSVPFQDALRAAPFGPNPSREDRNDVDRLREAFARDEARRSTVLGLPVVGADLMRTVKPDPEP